MRQTAARAAIATLVIGGVVVAALALWKLKVLIALLFLAFIIAAAMRPSVDALARNGVPRAAAILLHYVGLVALIAGLLYAVVPRALDQVETAVGDLPGTRAELREEARESQGIKQRILVGLADRLERL